MIKDILEENYWTDGFDLGKATEELLNLFNVSNWVAITENHSPGKCTEVMIKHKDGRKEVAYFDVDGRFYKQNDDVDVTDLVSEWHELP